MPEKGNSLSRNPNVCASCSSMADGMEESIGTAGPSLEPNQELAPDSAEALARGQLEHIAAEPAVHHSPR